MLQYIHIKNFTLIEQLELDLQSGMTVITGETGAGKSIVIDALQLALGNRADANSIGKYDTRCQISASFDLSKLPQVASWLREQNLDSDDECVLRRVLSHDGRSKAYINGHVAPLQRVRELGQLLVDVHGQHQHQSLARPDVQRQLLDKFADHESLLNAVTLCAQQIHDTEQQLQALSQSNDEQDARVQLLEFQVNELNELSLADGELQTLEQEHQQLSQAENLVHSTQQILAMSADDEPSTLSFLNHIHQELQQLHSLLPRFDRAIELVNQAIIHTQEAYDEIHGFSQELEINPARLLEIETRLSKIHNIARKHKVKPEAIIDLQKALQQSLDQALHAEQHITRLQQQLDTQQQAYQVAADALHESRQKAALTLSKQVSSSMKKLAMPKGHFAIALDYKANKHFPEHGLDTVCFEVTTNPGQGLQALNKVASGGELSRISLSIQVVTAQYEITPTLIFDEVDVGIGGGTAEVVGQLLHRLTKTYQVLCITHLPQVAAQGNHHLRVEKSHGKKTTQTVIQPLNEKQRVEEIARMLGGVKITEQTMAHAKEMLGFENA